jgi:hypothetical protein
LSSRAGEREAGPYWERSPPPVHADAHAAFHAAVPDTLRKAERARNRLDAAGPSDNVGHPDRA